MGLGKFLGKTFLLVINIVFGLILVGSLILMFIGLFNGEKFSGSLAGALGDFTSNNEIGPVIRFEKPSNSFASILGFMHEHDFDISNMINCLNNMSERGSAWATQAQANIGMSIFGLVAAPLSIIVLVIVNLINKVFSLKRKISKENN